MTCFGAAMMLSSGVGWQPTSSKDTGNLMTERNFSKLIVEQKLQLMLLRASVQNQLARGPNQARSLMNDNATPMNYCYRSCGKMTLLTLTVSNRPGLIAELLYWAAGRRHAAVKAIPQPKVLIEAETDERRSRRDCDAFASRIHAYVIRQPYATARVASKTPPKHQPDWKLTLITTASSMPLQQPSS